MGSVVFDDVMKRKTLMLKIGSGDFERDARGTNSAERQLSFNVHAIYNPLVKSLLQPFTLAEKA